MKTVTGNFILNASALKGGKYVTKINGRKKSFSTDHFTRDFQNLGELLDSISMDDILSWGFNDKKNGE